ncbi:MAG: hypothetical protein QOH12_909 [Solirubrobacteraceae bacterium]|jgi:hypothetical protein|nr:hypothetical protein [Solirubrobacteraceae bacterium]
MSLRGKVGTVGAVVTLGQLAMIVREHWQSIPARHRNRVQTLVTRSGGRPSNLSRAEQAELRGLVSELRLAELARRIGPVALGSGRRGSRRLY